MLVHVQRVHPSALAVARRPCACCPAAARHPAEERAAAAEYRRLSAGVTTTGEVYRAGIRRGLRAALHTPPPSLMARAALTGRYASDCRASLKASALSVAGVQGGLLRGAATVLRLPRVCPGDAEDVECGAFFVGEFVGGTADVVDPGAEPEGSDPVGFGVLRGPRGGLRGRGDAATRPRRKARPRSVRNASGWMLSTCGVMPMSIRSLACSTRSVWKLLRWRLSHCPSLNPSGVVSSLGDVGAAARVDGALWRARRRAARSAASRDSTRGRGR